MLRLAARPLRRVRAAITRLGHCPRHYLTSVNPLFSLSAGSYPLPRSLTISQARQLSTSSSQLHPEVQKLFKYVTDSLTPMFDSNEGMSITVEGPVLTFELGRGLGAYTLMVDPVLSSTSRPVVMLASPVSGGVWKYTRGADGQWASLEDGHYLVELWARELVAKCFGYPMF